MLSGLFAIVKAVGIQRLITLLVFLTGVGLELNDRTVLGAELIALSAVKLLSTRDGRGGGDSATGNEEN
jgi:hypothetical protein